MIATHESPKGDQTDVWTRLAAPLPTGVIAWRQDGKPVARDGGVVARFVAYIEANTVRERLDAVVPGEWDLTLELMPPLAATVDDDGPLCSFKARLQVLGVIREDVGTGRDYKQAATDAFKRAAVRFGIGHELYAYEQNWVPVDSEGRHAKPLEDPQAVYTRRYRTAGGDGSPAPARSRRASAARRVASSYEQAPKAGPPDDETESPAASGPATAATGALAGGPATDDVAPPCPRCSGRMWDNRLTKRNPKAPDFKCRDRSCDGVVWPARLGSPGAAATAGSGAELVSTLPLAADDLPF